jgi:hypothetical protein
MSCGRHLEPRVQDGRCVLPSGASARFVKLTYNNGDAHTGFELWQQPSG